jgi:hypothetical protein
MLIFVWPGIPIYLYRLSQPITQNLHDKWMICQDHLNTLGAKWYDKVQKMELQPLVSWFLTAIPPFLISLSSRIPQAVRVLAIIGLAHCLYAKWCRLPLLALTITRCVYNKIKASGYIAGSASDGLRDAGLRGDGTAGNGTADDGTTEDGTTAK